MNSVGHSVVDPDPRHFVNLDPHPDPHPHQTKIGIRIRIRINLQIDDNPNTSLFEHFFKGLS
jgi:hypothetical protein